MHFRSLSALAALLVVAACSDAPSPVQPETESAEASANASPMAQAQDRYIVVFRDGVGNANGLTDEIMRGNGGSVHHRYGTAIQGFSATLPAAALQGIRNNPNVAYIELDGVVTTTESQNNPPSWGLDRIDQTDLALDNSYTYQNDGSGVRAYIIDSGIRMDHQEYAGRAFSGYDFIGNDPDASDCHGHGTHVAGTVGGSTTGVAKGVSLYGVRVLGCNGSGSWSQVIAGIDWVAANHVKPSVANMSLGGGFSNSVNGAIQGLVAAGVPVAVSAGNDNADACTKSPASASSALTVASSTSSDVRSSFSNWGGCVDVFAPGSGIWSSTQNSTGSYGTWSGTSMASPHVAGIAALYLASNPNATPSQVETAIESNGTLGRISNAGSGTPNLLVYSLIAGSVTPPPPVAPVAAFDVSATSGDAPLTVSFTDQSSNTPTSWAWDFKDGSTSTAQNPTHTFDNPGTYEVELLASNSAGGTTATRTIQVNEPAPPPSADPVYLRSVDGISGTKGRKWWYGQLTAVVEDAGGKTVRNAIVHVSWIGTTSGSSTCSTDRRGRCRVRTGNMTTSSPGSVTMTVTDVTGAGIELAGPPQSVVISR